MSVYPISPKVRWIVSAWIAPPGVERRSTDDPIAQGAVKCLLLGVREPAKGSVDCVHQFRRPLLNSQERRASRHPSAAATRPYGTAALRGAAATDPDTPARSAAGDRRPAAASQRLGITGAAFRFPRATLAAPLDQAASATRDIAFEPGSCRPLGTSSSLASRSKARPTAANSLASRGPAGPRAKRKHRSA